MEILDSEYVLLLLGLGLLIFGGELLVRHASGLAIKAKVAPLIVGLTVIALGTSSPELFTSLQAAWSGQPGIAVGNVVGSNIANLALALGLTALIRPLNVDKKLMRLDWPLLMIVTLSFGALAFDGKFSRIDGVILLVSMFIYTAVQILRSKRIKKDKLQFELENEVVEVVHEGFDETASRSYVILILWIIVGCLLLYFGSGMFIDGASKLAINFGISEHVVGVTVVAFGTSVPEVVASVTAALKGQTDLSIGNLIGSNIMNILLVLGATSTISAITIDPEIIANDFWWMLGTAALLYPIMTIGNKISRFKGALYLICYLVYIGVALY